MKRPLRHSRAFKVTDFGTSQKLIYEFLVVINTNLPPVLHCFQVMVKFSLARAECLSLTLSLEVIHTNIVINDILLKTTFFGLHFCCRKYQCIFTHLYLMCPESYRMRWNDANLGSIMPFKVIQSHLVCTNRKLIGDLLLVINNNLPPILNCFRNIAFGRSKIAIFSYPSCI